MLSMPDNVSFVDMCTFIHLRKSRSLHIARDNGAATHGFYNGVMGNWMIGASYNICYSISPLLHHPYKRILQSQLRRYLWHQ
jgi:hypothetical protein